MVDAEGLRLAEGLCHGIVDLARAAKIGAQRLFQPDPHVGRGQPGGAEPANGRLEQRGRGREEDREAIVDRADPLGQQVKVRDLRGVERLVAQPRHESPHRLRIPAAFRQEFLQGFQRHRLKSGIVEITPGGPENAQIRGNQPVEAECIERGQQHAPGQIAGGAEQQDCARVMAVGGRLVHRIFPAACC